MPLSAVNSLQQRIFVINYKLHSFFCCYYFTCSLPGGE